MTEELDDNQLSELARQLDSLEQELNDLLNVTESGAKPVKLKDNQGRLSRMDEMHNQSILIANRNVARNRLKAIRVAKQKLSEDYYGYCEGCDEAIAFNRLLAYPDASRCIQCQSDAE